MFSVLSRKVILERGKWYHNSNSIGSNHLIRETLLGEDDIDISFFLKIVAILSHIFNEYISTQGSE